MMNEEPRVVRYNGYEIHIHRVLGGWAFVVPLTNNWSKPFKRFDQADAAVRRYLDYKGLFKKAPRSIVQGAELEEIEAKPVDRTKTGVYDFDVE